MGWVRRRGGYSYYQRLTLGGRRRYICLYRNGVATDLGDEMDRLFSTLVRPVAAKKRRSRRRVDVVGELRLLARQKTELAPGQESDGSGNAANRDAPEPILDRGELTDSPYKTP